MMIDFTPLILSIKLAALSTIILLFLCAPLTYLLAFRKFRGKLLVEAFIGLPLVLPPTVFGFYMLILLGSEGVVGRLYQSLLGKPLIFTFAGIVLASMLHSLPYVVQPLKVTFEKIDPRLLESAAVLGCSQVATFFRVVLPNSLGGIMAAAILTFAHAMGGFGVILMVGGSIPGKTKVASIAIYEYVEAMRYDQAWLLSMAMLIISYMVLLFVNFLNRSKNYGTQSLH